MVKKSNLDWALEALSIVALAAIFVTVAMNWQALPRLVPRHFDLDGNPDAWGRKNTLWVLVGTAAGMYVLLTVAARIQKFINAPIVRERDVPEVRRILGRMVRILKFVLTTTLFYMIWATVYTALGRVKGMGSMFLPLSMVATFIPVLFYAVQLRRYNPQK